MATRLLSHLAHVELFTPKLDESVKFFKEVLGLTESGRADESVFLRCWGDYYVYSLILTKSDKPALAHAAWRTNGPEELIEAVQRIEASGVQGRWIETRPITGAHTGSRALGNTRLRFSGKLNGMSRRNSYAPPIRTGPKGDQPRNCAPSTGSLNCRDAGCAEDGKLVLRDAWIPVHGDNFG